MASRDAGRRRFCASKIVTARSRRLPACSMRSTHPSLVHSSTS
jgi:hypothetical protein